MPMIDTTTMSSMRVKPASPPRAPALPVLVTRPIQSLALVGGIHVEHVLAAPGGAVGLVLVAALAPLLGVGQGVERDAPQEAQLLPRGAHLVDALHQHVEVGGIALAAELHVGPPDLPVLDGGLVLVDGPPQLPERPV